MTTLPPPRRENAEKRARAILDLATRVCELLRDRLELPSNLAEEIHRTIHRSFPLPTASILAHNNSHEFDSVGCEIWNAVTNALRRDDHVTEGDVQQNRQRRIFPLLRVFAFFLIDTADHVSPKSTEDANPSVRNFKVGLKASKFCLDNSELDLALRALERCSEHVSASDEASPLVHIIENKSKDGRAASHSRLVAEYRLLRMAHAWKSERMDLAEHFLAELSILQLRASSRLREDAADLFYEIGKAFLKRGVPEAGIKWLDQGLEVLRGCDIGPPSSDEAELRLAISSSLVLALCQSRDQRSLSRANELVHQLLSTSGPTNSALCQSLQVTVVLSQPQVNVMELQDATSKLARSPIHTEHGFKVIMKAIHRVHKVSTQIARDALNELITTLLTTGPRVSTGEDQSASFWLESASITYVHFITNDHATASDMDIRGLQSAFDAITERHGSPLSSKAIHAAQALIWKATNASASDTAEQWCKLLLHPVFAGAGPTNQAKIGRKAMMLAMSREDFNAAKEAFYQMTSSAQKEGLSRYLCFKLALRMDDYNLAVECLGEVSKQADKDTTYLYACVLEAQQSHMRHMAIAALQALLDKRPAEIQVPALLRCTARLLSGELEAKDSNSHEAMEELVRVFETAASDLKIFQSVDDQQWRNEIQWWRKNAYNTSLRVYSEAHPEHLVRLLAVCTKFIDAHPSEVDEACHTEQMANRKKLCHFLSASALVVLGRSSDEGSEYRVQCYLQAQQEIKAFFATSHNRSIGHDSARRRSFEMLKFNLECILNSQHWDQLNEAIKSCLEFENVDRWDTLADLVLIIHQRAKVNAATSLRMSELLERIINETWKKEKDIVKAARWLRLSFSIDLSDGDGDFSLKLLQQAAGMAKKGYEGRSESFPETELQWLATTSFNRAVDLLGSGDIAGSRGWIEDALNLARYAADNGSLHANLTHKREQMVQRMGLTGM